MQQAKQSKMTFDSSPAGAKTTHKHQDQQHAPSPSGERRHSCTSDVCFSLSNIALIVSCLVALLYLARFLSNDPLYEYGEYIVSLAFYRQLIYITAVVPLALLVPLYNSLSACLPFEGRKRHQSSYTIARILYLALLVVLLFVGLVFVVGYIRFEAVAKQIDHEMRKHMHLRYTNPFSFQFTESIQSKYECCDTLWYRNTYSNKLPLSCMKADTGHLDQSFTQTCSNVLGYLISNRCIVISVCLFVAIVALIGLIVIDTLDLAGREYTVVARDSASSYLRRQPADSESAGGGAAAKHRRPADSRNHLVALPSWPRSSNRDDGTEADDESQRDDDHDIDRDAEPAPVPAPARLAGLQQRPPSDGLAKDEETYPDAEADVAAYLEAPQGDLAALTSSAGLGQRKQRITKTIVTTRTSYIANKRTQSPLLVPVDGGGGGRARSMSPSGESGSLLSQDQQQQQRRSKSVLKTSRTSLANVDDDDAGEGADAHATSSRQGFREPDGDDLQEHQLKLHRDLKIRRSLLNVRFAD